MTRIKLKVIYTSFRCVSVSIMNISVLGKLRLYEMSLKTYKYFFLTYFSFGLCPFYSLKPSVTITCKYGKYFHMIPCCVSISISLVFFIYFSFVNRNIFLMYGKINDLVGYCYLLCLIMSSLSGNYQCLRYRNEYFRLLKRNFRMRKSLYLGSSYNAGRVKKKFLATVLLSGTTYFLVIPTLFLNEFKIESTPYKVGIVLLHLTSSLNSLHLIMYIEMIRSYVETSGKFIFDECIYQTGIMQDDERYWNLKKLKKMYFDWWNIVQIISCYFGWSIIALLTKSFVEICYTFYYYFMTQPNLDTVAILRNLNIFKIGCKY